MNPPYDWVVFVQTGRKIWECTNTYPSPNPNPLLIDIAFSSPDPTKVGNDQQCARGDVAPGYHIQIPENSPSSVHLISGLKKPEVIFHRVPQPPTLITRSSPVNNNDDVLVVGGKDRVPISVETDVDLLRAGPVVPVGVYPESQQRHHIHQHLSRRSRGEIECEGV